MFEDELGSSLPKHLKPRHVLFREDEVIDGRFVVVNYIASGGMGSVLKVVDLYTFKELALKYCNPEICYSRFRREIRMMQSVNCEHVVQVCESNLEYDPPYFCMPIAQHSIHDLLPELAQDEGRAIRTFQEICVGIRSLHKNGIFHRDIKPPNALVMSDGRIVVSDLGLGRFQDRDTTILTKTIAHLGTEDYLAPEQKGPEGSRNADARTDIYQLGIILYQLITGRSPSSRHYDYTGIPSVIVYIIKKATNPNPNARYQTVTDLMRAIERYIESTAPNSNPILTFTNVIERLCTESTTTTPSPQDVELILESLFEIYSLGNDQLINHFHMIPYVLLTAIACQSEDQLNMLLIAYTNALQQRISTFDFDVADRISDRMSYLYENTSSIEIKVLALLSILIAADHLNRFYAQKQFRRLIQSITTIDIALPVSDMISSYGTPYTSMFNTIDTSLCHAAIRDVLNNSSSSP